MRAQNLIAKKRDGNVLSNAEITTLIDGIVSGQMSDGQLGAMAMAIYNQGLTDTERVALTLAMRDSGRVLSWDLPGPVVDKHSTGGVGDCVSLVLAPALAACGVYVPMVSGRGLGHTGGTLDKLDAIPGYQTDISIEDFQRIVGDVGCAIIGQTPDVAPADKRLYGMRDETSTVSTLDLITPSILSKKLASGVETLVLDVKLGNGAFMTGMAEAGALAQALVSVANGAGCKTTAFITDMDEPLAASAGNALEITSVVGLLTGTEVDTRLWDLTVALGGELLTQAGLDKGADRISDALSSGQAAERFGRMVAQQGGPVDFMEKASSYLPAAPLVKEVYISDTGFVDQIDTTALGQIVVDLGGGRQVATDTIDYAVGLDWILGRGMLVGMEQPVARVHARTEDDMAAAVASLKQAFTVSDQPPEDTPLIHQRIS